MFGSFWPACFGLGGANFSLQIESFPAQESSKNPQFKAPKFNVVDPLDPRGRIRPDRNNSLNKGSEQGR